MRDSLLAVELIDTTDWLLADFVGMSKPLERLPLQTLLSAYSLFLLAVLIASLTFIPALTRIKPVLKSEASN